MGDYRHNPPYMEDINTHLLFTVWIPKELHLMASLPQLSSTQTIRLVNEDIRVPYSHV